MKDSNLELDDGQHSPVPSTRIYNQPSPMHDVLLGLQRHHQELFDDDSEYHSPLEDETLHVQSMPTPPEESSGSGPPPSSLRETLEDRFSNIGSFFRRANSPADSRRRSLSEPADLHSNLFRRRRNRSFMEHRSVSNPANNSMDDALGSTTEVELTESSAFAMTHNYSEVPTDPDIQRERLARSRWIRINRRFQLVITVVALVFSLLLFVILICWVVLVSAFVLNFERPCANLKMYFWLVTLQLILDVFRTDIMRFAFHWDARSNQQIPSRVIMYNICYLIYAMMVLRLGIRSVFTDEAPPCKTTAPDLFHASVAFVSLSIAAWSTIILGYLLPFCVVAVLLTINGYNPTTDRVHETQPVFPNAYSTSGAPPGCIDKLKVKLLSDFPESLSECVICQDKFKSSDIIVETKCKHAFHKVSSSCVDDVEQL